MDNTKLPNKKKKIEIEEFLRNLKDFLVHDDILNSNCNITPFDSSKGCPIEEAKKAYNVVCKVGAKKISVSIEFGVYLDHLFQNIWNSENETWEEFLKRNNFCSDTQALKYRKLSELYEFKKFFKLNYSFNSLYKRVDEIILYFSHNSKEKDFWK